MKRRPRHPNRRDISQLFWDAIHTRTLFRDGGGSNDDLLRIIQNITSLQAFPDVPRNMIAEPIGASLRTIGLGLHVSTFDQSCRLHTDCLHLISRFTQDQNVELAAFAIWALGDVGIPPIIVRDRLIELVKAPARSASGKTGTCRAVAFRMLARHDKDSANTFRDAPVFREFVQMLLDFRQHKSERYPDNKDLVNEIDAELEPWGLSG